MIEVHVYVDDATEKLGAGSYGAGALARLERATTEAGVYAEIVTLPLIAGQDDYTYFDPTGTGTSWYRSRVTTATGTLPSAYSRPFQVEAATLASVADVRALVKTGLTNDELSAVIRREETLLAARIGPLTGQRTEIRTITDRIDTLSVRLSRVTSAVTVTESNTATTDIRLLADGRSVRRLAATGWGSWPWGGVVEVTYTPTDTAAVTTAVIELVAARLAETPYDSETIGDYSYSRGTRSHAIVLRDAVADILGIRRSVVTSVQMTTSESPLPTWLGTVRP